MGPRSQASAASSAQQPSGQLDWCVACHALPGAYSVNTITQALGRAGPGSSARLSETPVSAALESSVAWKQKREDWILLQRLLRASAVPSRRIDYE